MILKRILLSILQNVYYLFSDFHNLLYDTGILKQVRCQAIVIGVGNIAFGGTGKTEVVSYLGKTFLNSGKKTAIVLKAYKSKIKTDIVEQNDINAVIFDEAALIKQRLPDAMVIVAREKWKGAVYADEKGAEIIIVDDALQHRKLKCDFMIGLYSPFSKFFRERFSALNRTNLVLISKLELVEESQREGVIKKVSDRLEENIPVIGVRYELDVPEIKGPVGAFTSIARPDNFFDLLKGYGCQLELTIPFPDHYRYEEKDVMDVCIAMSEKGIKKAMTTEKDMVKINNLLRLFEKYGVEVIPVRVKLAFLDELNQLDFILKRRINF